MWKKKKKKQIKSNCNNIKITQAEQANSNMSNQ